MMLHGTPRTTERGEPTPRRLLLSHPRLQRPSACIRVKPCLLRREPRVTIDAGFTCPNVDGTVTTGGCVYCDNRSFSPNRRLPHIDVRAQVERGVRILEKYYGADRFLVYFQAATNTYAPVEKLRRLWDEGKAGGPAESLDWEHTLAVARARLKEIVAENDARPSIAAIAPP